ncbi:MAG: ParB N-terminal domain-containing protein [bacterium]|nr:ParB N-terminal domain-containing protein [bacterium]
MSDNFSFNLPEALDAYKHRSLEEWTQRYLRNVGNNSGLADHLIENQPLAVKLVKFPLEQLKRIMGPEDMVLFPESSQKWEQRVTDLLIKVQKGELFAPLIVTNFWDPYQISDGNHRHEAFLRLGMKEYWVIFFERKN